MTDSDTDRLNADLAAQKADIEQLKRQLARSMAESEAMKSGGRVRPIAAHLAERIRFERNDHGTFIPHVVDERGNVMVTSQEGSTAQMEPGEFIESMKEDRTLAGFFAPVAPAQQPPQTQPTQQPRQTQRAASTSSTAFEDVLAKNPVERLKQLRRDQAEAASRAR